MDEILDGEELELILNSLSPTSTQESPERPLEDSSELREYYASYGSEIGPHLEIVEQPQRLYRFRYITEFKENPHGPLTGEKSVKSNKSFPTVKLHNYTKKAIIRCWLCVNNKKEVHCHQLLSKSDGKSGVRSEPHDVIVDMKNNFTAVFEGLNIIHAVTKQKDHLKSFHQKKAHIHSGYYPQLENYQYDEKCLRQEIKTMEKNKAVLFFQAFDFESKERLADIFSYEIRNSKNPKTSTLKIVRQSHERGVASGSTEVLIFVEKVTKDVKILFYEYDQSEQICWKEEAKIVELWHQVAIAFSTPPYHNENITEEKKIFFKLIRETDGSESNEMEFIYHPDYRNQPNYVEPVIGKKRRMEAIENNYPTYVSTTSPSTLSDLSSDEHSNTFADNSVTEHYLNNLAQANQLDTITTEYMDDSFYNIINSFGFGNEEQIEFPTSIDSDSATVVPDKLDLFADSSDNKTLAGNAPAKSDIKELINSLFRYVTEQDHSNKVHDTLLKLRQNNVKLNDLRNVYRKTPLHIAIEKGSAEFIPLLVNAGFDVNAVDIDCDSALHLAVKYDAGSDIIKSLITAGAQLSTKNYVGETPVHLACRLKRLEYLQLFMPNLTSTQIIQDKCKKTGDTALHIAVKYGYHDVAELLIKKGAHVHVMNLARSTPFAYAVQNEDDKMVKLLLSSMNIEDRKNIFLVDVFLTIVQNDKIFDLLEAYVERFEEEIKGSSSTSNETDLLCANLNTKCNLKETVR